LHLIGRGDPPGGIHAKEDEAATGLFPLVEDSVRGEYHPQANHQGDGEFAGPAPAVIS